MYIVGQFDLGEILETNPDPVALWSFRTEEDWIVFVRENPKLIETSFFEALPLS